MQPPAEQCRQQFTFTVYSYGPTRSEQPGRGARVRRINQTALCQLIRMSASRGGGHGASQASSKAWAFGNGAAVGPCGTHWRLPAKQRLRCSQLGSCRSRCAGRHCLFTFSNSSERITGRGQPQWFRAAVLLMSASLFPELITLYCSLTISSRLPPTTCAESCLLPQSLTPVRPNPPRVLPLLPLRVPTCPETPPQC